MRASPGCRPSSPVTGADTLIGFVDLGPFSVVLAVVLAAAKASLIVMFFVHALYEFKLAPVIIAGGIMWLLGNRLHFPRLSRFRRQVVSNRYLLPGLLAGTAHRASNI